MTTTPQTLTLAGEDYVVIPREEYERLRPAADEDATDVAAIQRVLDDLLDALAGPGLARVHGRREFGAAIGSWAGSSSKRPRQWTNRFGSATGRTCAVRGPPSGSPGSSMLLRGRSKCAPHVEGIDTWIKQAVEEKASRRLRGLENHELNADSRSMSHSSASQLVTAPRS